jgi:hypothetical protein
MMEFKSEEARLNLISKIRASAIRKRKAREETESVMESAIYLASWGCKLPS